MRIESTDFPNPNSNPNFSPSFSSLSNPLLDQNSQIPTAGCGPHQFSPSPVTGIRNPRTPVSGGHQFQNSYSPYPPSNPMEWRSSSFVNQGSPSFNSAPGRGHQFNNSPSPVGNPYPVYQGSPNFRSPPPIRSCWYNNSPYSNSSPNSVGRSSPSPGPGRGRGRWDNNNRGSNPRYSSGRGRGFNFNNQARSFYHISMVEDPWKSLTPVIWKGDNNNIWSKYSNQESLHTPVLKKPRVSDPFDKSDSKQSLAEFLAASFDEAVGAAAGS